MAMYRVRVVSSGWSGGPGLSTFYFQPSADPTVTGLEGAQACVGGVRAYLDRAKALVPNSWTAQINSAVDVLAETNGELSTTWATAPVLPVIGTGVGGYLPIATALNLSFLTTSIKAGHRVRGRTFFGPVGGVGEPDGSPIESALVELAVAGDLLIAPVGAQAKLVVWARPFPGKAATATAPAIPARLGSAHVVVSTQVRDKFAVLRSRRD